MDTRVENFSLPLFVPADRPDRFSKAVQAGPDAVIIDLEDAVAPGQKAVAREGLAAAFNGPQTSIPFVVRINGVCTPWHADDVAAVSALPFVAIMLPKAETSSDIELVAERTAKPVIALVESARGLGNIRQFARQCARIAFGSIDYAADLAMEHTRSSLLSARSELVLASRMAGIPAPIDGVTTVLHDSALVMDDCAYAAGLGFGGKLLIHPAQIGPARNGFRPSQRQIDWAERVLESAAGGGATSLDGAMIDPPVLLQAQQIIKRAVGPST